MYLDVLVMERLEGRPLGAITADEQIGDRQALARTLFDTLQGEVMIDGIFHADPHPGNVRLLANGQLALLDFGSVGRIDSGLRAGVQRLLVAVDRGDPAALNDALLEIVQRPEELDEPALERALGVFMARHVGAGITPDVRMFADLFRIIAEHELSVPPEIAGAFRALATIEGTLTQLAPGFDILTDARRFTIDYLAAQLSPAALRKTATNELISLVPMLRRLPRRLDRLSGSLEHARLGLNVRLLADEGDRRYLTGLLHQLVLAFLAATLGVMSVLMLGLHGGPRVTHSVTLYAFFGYCLLVFARGPRATRARARIPVGYRLREPIRSRIQRPLEAAEDQIATLTAHSAACVRDLRSSLTGRAHVAAHCALADDKLGRNLLVRPPLGQLRERRVQPKLGLPVSPF